MAKGDVKEAAEAALRELPSVVGAFVKEDVYGHPREIHLLIRPGPDPRYRAHDARDLLEERLGIPVDQRVISIAQLAAPTQEALPEAPEGTADPDVAAEPSDEPGSGGYAVGTAPASEPAAVRPRDVEPRLQFLGGETLARDARGLVRARLSSGGQELQGEAVELEAASGRARAGAAAALHAISGAANLQGRLELENATVVRVEDRDYVLASVLASSPYLGRRPLSLAGAQPIEVDVESAGALAALKAVNRVASLMLRLAAHDAH
ncbi:MAG: hypothetical protein FIB01_08205 [Gemmatimonadetes bacterium]|nr:hypothetical protein [Gemmatimonadota bacterium]